MLVVCCRVRGARWGFAARDIAGVVPAVPLRPVPGAPPEVAGLLRRAGALVPVLDLGVLAGDGSCADRLGTRILLVRRGGGLVGLRAERVLESVEVDEAALVEPPIASPGAPWLGPFAASDGDLVQLVRTDALLPPALAALLDVAVAGAAP